MKWNVLSNPPIDLKQEAREVLKVLTIDDVHHVYVGKANHCVCGCAGARYYKPGAYHSDCFDIIDEEIVKSIFNLVKENAKDVEAGLSRMGHQWYCDYLQYIRGETMYILYLK